MSEYNPDHTQQEHIEVERTEYKTIARRVLRDLFENILEVPELEQKLTSFDDVKIVTRAQMDAIAANHPRDAGADGLIHYEVSDTEVRRSVVVLHSSSWAETLHTLTHEGVHLLSPEPGLVYDPMAEPGEEVFSDYVGALRFERSRQTKEIDPLSIQSAFNSSFLFWEAVTDWLAELALAEELTEPQLEEIADSGYFERHWIHYLVRKSPDTTELIHAIKESYTSGSTDSFRWCLQKQLRVQNDRLYDSLLHIMGRNRTDEKRVDDWMTLVDSAFKTS